MSLLNMEQDGMPNLLLVLYRYLLAHGPTNEEKLIEVCAPAGSETYVLCDQNRAKKTMNTWAKLGLFVRGEGEVRLSPQLPDSVKDRKSGEASLRQVLRDLIFCSDNNDPFWGSEGVRAADFTRALAWCLAIDPLRLHGNGYDPVNRLELETLPNELEVFRNDTRWNGFKSWAVFLGFAWLARYPKWGTLVVDPTPAIRDILPLIFGPLSELSQRDFLIRLSQRIPVLDGGFYRVKVEDKLIRVAGNDPLPGELSVSLSLALKRLSYERVIEFKDLDDPAFGRGVLRGCGRRQLGSFSHVMYKGGCR